MSEYLERFKSVGKNVTIEPNVFIRHPEAMEVGDNVTFGRNMLFEANPKECVIGNDVRFDPGAYICGNAPMHLEDNVHFYPNVYISLGSHPHSFLRIAHTSHFAPNCVLYGGGGLNIGAYACVAAHTVFASVGHDHTRPDAGPMAIIEARSGPITLEEDVWIGANVSIIADTTIAKGCVIGAGAVVTKHTEPYGVYGGVPAKRIRDR